MQSKKGIVFSRNFPYNLGGAERSLLEEIKQNKFNVTEVLHAFQKEQDDNFLEGVKGLGFNINALNNFNLLPRFFYYEYLINKNRIKAHIEQSNFDVLITQNRWAPAAVNAANDMGKESIYYLRDETSLGILNNYYTGYKRLIRDVYKYLEIPGIKVFNYDNERALNNATQVISNSNYISSRLWDMYKVDSIVSYPKLDKNELIKSYNACLNNNEESNDGIVIIGDTKIKGIEVFIRLAKQFPNQRFYIFGKNPRFQSPLENIKHLGWSSNSAYPFSRAKLILVPSLWEEAYGRVAVEALTLNIPVIVSNRGGLPEAVNYSAESIANSFIDFKNKIKDLI